MIRQLARFTDKKTGRSGVRAKVLNPHGSGKLHDCAAYVLAPYTGRLVDQDGVQVTCQCSYFNYWGAEYGLNKYGFAELLRSESIPADVRNPRGKPVVCHHIHKLLLEIFSKKY